MYKIKKNTYYPKHPLKFVKSDFMQFFSFFSLMNYVHTEYKFMFYANN